ncbi:hypothetical protein ABZS44_07710 [Micromonospora sediminicola]|uniref:hypothetical protein n=1 Tax=Micromonospora sediminicola TaxID=946078 RepID=UPI0033A49099
MSARIGDALRALEHDVAGLRLSPSAEVRARGRARSRRRATVLAGVATVAVAGGAATLPALLGPAAAPVPVGGGAGAASATASARCHADRPVRLDVVFRPGAGDPQLGEVSYRISQARGDVGLRCGGLTVASRPDPTGRVVTSVLLADGEDPTPIRDAVAGLPGVERVVVTGDR